ncbi:GNAT family N-acetyltransferase [Actinoplanes lobatus]|uniref:N-acetyltransferase domain-containing protein n=1 Tax=Actinoplanes lobatus TaxID=113568 RepID=A0A7W7ML86_9ACTN|nr:GNAT family N-acetyltransferase [Actinoplanes lobatus]MBB4754263.1 hypothetical protein [Actinoplanes lobatus]
MTLEIRPLTGPGELDLFNSFDYVLNEEIPGDLSTGHRRPEWLWVAVRDGRVTARAAWWSRHGDEKPMFMDILDVAPGHLDDGVRLIEAATVHAPEYVRFVPPDWRDHGHDWLHVLERSGARLFVERLRLQWQPGTPVRPTTGRLVFREPHAADELIGLMERVLDGTLDAHSRAELARMSPRECAAQQYHEELSRYPSPPEWWRVATLPDGDPVGFVIPAHNGYNPILAYIGVVPEHRGRGHIDDLLAEGTRLLAGQDVPRIRASTDLGNVPMAAAFARGGYAVLEHQVDMTW